MRALVHRFRGIEALVVAVAIALASGCLSCSRQASRSDAAPAVSYAPVAEPEGVVAEVWVRAPETTWSRVQRGTGGAFGLMPATIGGLVCALVGIDPSLGAYVDGRGTSTAVIAQTQGAAGIAWAVALPLTDDRKAESLLLDGDASRYSVRDVDGMRVVSRADRPMQAAAAIARGYLVVARDDDDLARLGPYAWRTMPTKPAPASSASIVALSPHAALADVAGARLMAKWSEARGWLLEQDRQQRARHGGRAADFGDPAGIVAALDALIGRRAALVSSAKEARVEIDASEDEVHAELTLAPGDDAQAGSLVAAMRPGDARPLLECPGDAVAALMLRDDAPSRIDDAQQVASAVQSALGPARLGEKDARALHKAFSDWASARGDWMTVSLGWAAARGVWLRTPAAGDASRAVRGWIDLSRLRAVKEPLATLLHLAPPGIEAADVPGAGRSSIARFGAGGVAWTVKDGDLLAAAGADPRALLASQAAPSSKLADDARTARSLSVLADRAVFAVVAQPLRFDPVHASAPSAPFVLAWGRKDAQAWLRIELADPLLREAVRFGAGF